MVETVQLDRVENARLDGEQAPELAIVVPSFNERDNIKSLYEKVTTALAGVPFEFIVVDDNSPDGTAELTKELSRQHSNIRCIRRFGRRGLSSACVEGMASTAAPYVAVIDADHQHDERILPEMLAAAKAGADIAIGSRFVEDGSVGKGLSSTRLKGSEFATRLASFIVGRDISDPMSGFFLMPRRKFEEVAPFLNRDGFKILLDILATSARHGAPLSVREVGYSFRERNAGESKMSSIIVVQFLGLWLSQLTNGRLPMSFLLFAMVGISGLLVHLAVLWLTNVVLAIGFVAAQIVATLSAMVWNFFLNNTLTYADRKLKGRKMVIGLIEFIAICSVGGIASVSVASNIYASEPQPLVAGVAGALMSAVFNYCVTRAYTWK
ncbi:dolichol-phosphate mannosyltransferase [Kaistia soli DSM 19436]|uniref:Dolichol-phosphate mannosyltransferase n=1 Tax=Kaistia soli DSM 19436 TaxID=1122133 RepID=A0A1M4ZIK8_9HYPH|nr:glycosyltransferase family 2 protein [Kaistia soli]SHF17841.1 dolichol-phosphate mannosyltransferase [Kaistia soli DSM 19436]